MPHQIEGHWIGKITFPAQEPEGNLILNPAVIVGAHNRNLRPKAWILSVISGYTGVDVASLIKKMRLEDAITNFSNKTARDSTKEYPKCGGNLYIQEQKIRSKK